MHDQVRRQSIATGAAIVLVAALVSACSGAAASSLPKPECSISVGTTYGQGGNYSVSLDPPYDGSNKKYTHMMQSTATAAVDSQPGEWVSLGQGQTFQTTSSGLYSVVATVNPKPGVKLPAATCSNDVYITVIQQPAPIKFG